MRHPKSSNRWLLGLVLASTCVGSVAAVLWRATRAEPWVPGPLAENGAMVVRPVALQQARRPSLEGGTGWINSGPIRLEELRGKVVLLDFWTYCCINCHHVLPDLARLEQKYKNELVVIGVHSPKFYAERDTENLRQKVREYQIQHPVINDADQVLWNAYGIESWPTLVLIDPTGAYYGSVSGEGNYAVLDREIGKLVAHHREKGDLNESPLKFYAESEHPDDGGLAFPGKVCADAEGKRLFIADTAHNRIVLAGLDGAHPVAIGEGTPGLVDGSFAKAEFNRPQGMCLVGETLYVADTENHALRAVDLKAKTVTTVAGTGKQTHNFDAHGPGKTTPLSSPWDVVAIPATQSLMIAMAGQHQIWRYDLTAGTVGVFAGTGAENIDAAPTPAAEAVFAQPSGLATDGHSLFVADSETSSIRAIALSVRGKHIVQTIVGTGLFVFDDVDGQGDEVRLQHDLGLAYGGGKLYVADSYNNRVKVCNPASRTVETLVGTHLPGDSDNPPKFYQPGGLSLAGGKLYVADTNNGKIKVIDLKDNHVTTLELDGLKPPSPRPRKPSFPKALVTEAPKVQVAPGKTLTFDVSLRLPAGAKLNDQAPMPYLVEAPAQPDALDASEAGGQQVKPPAARFPITVALAKPATAGETLQLKLSVSAFVCNEGSGLCQIKSYVWNVPIAFASGGRPRVPLEPVAQKEK